MSLDLADYSLAAAAANILVIAVGALEDADAIDRLADHMCVIASPSRLHPLVISDLRVRAEHVRELALGASRRRGRA